VFVGVLRTKFTTLSTAVECTKFRCARVEKHFRAQKKKETVYSRGPTRGGVKGESVCDKPKFSNRLYSSLTHCALGILNLVCIVVFSFERLSSSNTIDDGVRWYV
jgi:hypothetical protein